MGGDRENVTTPVIFPLPVPVLHAAVTGNDPTPALLKRKHEAEFNQEVNNELQAKGTSHSPVPQPRDGTALVCLYSEKVN